MTSDYDWALCRTFLAVVRSGSFSGAARSLGQAQPTVRRQIEQLERAAGATLFSRSPDGVHLTPTANRLVSYAERLEAAAKMFVRAAERDRYSGVVRIAADDLIGTHLLMPILTRLRQDHPDLRFALSSTRDKSDIMRRSVDLAISATPPHDPSVIASRVATLEFGFFGRRGGIHATDPLISAADLMSRRLLVGSAQMQQLSQAIGAEDIPLPEEHFALHTGDEVTVMSAVLEGLGVGLLPTAIAGSIESLERVLPNCCGRSDMWLSTHPDLRSAAQVRLVLDAIRRGFAAAR